MLSMPISALGNRYFRLLVAILLILSVSVSCRRNPSASESSDSSASDSASVEEYYADNDIAMTVKSIADAINVGEPLDSASYTFEGVLTDGQGTPLYTDIQGSPGQWRVVVVREDHAIIRNLYLGDLLPDYLKGYITQSLALSADNAISSEEEDGEDIDEECYSIGNGIIRFITRSVAAPNGQEGPLMIIELSGETPAGTRR